jgi:hypothetical protein
VRRAWTTNGLAALACVAALGCGSGSPRKAPSSASVTVAPPTRPTATECATGVKILPHSNVAAKALLPAAGRYQYTTRGTFQVGLAPALRLPTTTEIIVTPGQRVGNYICLRVQRRFGSANAATALVALHGTQQFALGAAVSIGRLRLTISPTKPIFAGNVGSLSSSGSYTAVVHAEGPAGSFSGPVVATYAVDVIGIRRITASGTTFRVLGIQVRSAYSGQGVLGRQRSIEWISLQRRLLVAERVWSMQKAAGRVARLNYYSSLRNVPG